MFEQLVAQEKELIFTILGDKEELVDIFEEDVNDYELNANEFAANLKKLSKLNANEITSTSLNGSDMARRLKNLFRRAKEDYQERGIHILHVVFGCDMGITQKLSWLIESTGIGTT